MALAHSRPISSSLHMVPCTALFLMYRNSTLHGIGVTTLCELQLPCSLLENLCDKQKITAVVSGSLAYGAIALARVRIQYLLGVLTLILSI